MAAIAVTAGATLQVTPPTQQQTFHVCAWEDCAMPRTSLVPSGASRHDLPAELRLAQAISEFALSLDDAGKQKF